MFWFGLAAGVMFTVPLAAVAARRWARRVQSLEQHARAVERRAEMGDLTGGLAHEIKNPLSTMGMNHQLIREDLTDLANELGPQADDARDRLGRITRRFDSLSRETQRLGDILKDFLDYAHPPRLDRKPINVNDLITELCDFFLPQAQAAGVRLRTQFDAPNPTIVIDAPLLKQALLNLMINACHAMSQARQRNEPSGGNDELIIRSQRGAGVPGHAGEIHVHVIDTGPGMDRDTQAKIFHPYFTNRPGGTGLGLPTARRIIEEHQGTLTCHSEPARGTDFVIALPYQTDVLDPI